MGKLKFQHDDRVRVVKVGRGRDKSLVGETGVIKGYTYYSEYEVSLDCAPSVIIRGFRASDLEEV